MSDPTPIGVVPDFDPIQYVREAAQALATARTDFAETFIRAKAASRKPLTDRECHEMTVAATKDAVTIAEAELKIALQLLGGNHQ